MEAASSGKLTSHLLVDLLKSDLTTLRKLCRTPSAEATELRKGRVDSLARGINGAPSLVEQKAC
jgi:hypothetical protein